MKLLNLGCGTRYHNAWTNVDFISFDKNIISHNLLQGIPFHDNSYDVIYHSHVLEHFTKVDGQSFMKECFRVLKPEGILRIAVPDLERIAKEYLRNLELAIKGNEKAKHNYEWIKLELYDQVVRNEGGGDMAKYLFQKEIPNEEYVFERIGEEGLNLRNSYLKSLQEIKAENKILKSYRKNNGEKFITDKIRDLFKKFFFKRQIDKRKKLHREASIGQFRSGGEIHQWMYDRYSLGKLLIETGFDNIEVKDAFSSRIENWNKFQLESRNETIYKPDSLFMEAVKK